MVTTIMAASTSGYLDHVERLIELGANILLKSCNEMNLLEWAKSFSKNEIIELIENYQ